MLLEDVRLDEDRGMSNKLVIRKPSSALTLENCFLVQWLALRPHR